VICVTSTYARPRHDDDANVARDITSACRSTGSIVIARDCSERGQAKIPGLS